MKYVKGRVDDISSLIGTSKRYRCGNLDGSFNGTSWR